MRETLCRFDNVCTITTVACCLRWSSSAAVLGVRVYQASPSVRIGISISLVSSHARPGKIKNESFFLKEKERGKKRVARGMQVLSYVKEIDGSSVWLI